MRYGLFNLRSALRGVQILLIGLVAISVQSTSVGAQAGVTIETGSATSANGGAIELPVNVQSGTTTIGAITLEIAYDSSVVEVTSCTIGNGLAGACNSSVAGLVKLSAVSFGGVSGDTTVATIAFTAIGQAGESTPLSLSVTTLADTTGRSVGYSGNDGEISIMSPCGPLSQEAEDGELSGTFAVASRGDGSGGASGGAYVQAPDRSGDAAAGPDGVNFAKYCVTVPEDGLYRILATTSSADAGANSFYVLVDGAPVNGFLWGTPIDLNFNATYVADRGGANPVELQLTEGDHEIVFALREDGTQLDKFELEAVDSAQSTPSVCAGLKREAEEGVPFGSFVVANDSNASGGQYIHAPSGSAYDGPNSLQRVDYCFTVDQAGDYYIKGEVYSPDNASNSFYAKVNDEPEAGVKWTTPVNSGYEVAYLSGGAGQYVATLSPGEQIVSVYLREPNNRLDTLELEPLGQAPTGPLDCIGMESEAELGRLSGGFAVGNDTNASGGQFVHVPSGGGDEYSGPNMQRKADYCFTVEEAGDYVIAANVYGADDGSNSFYVQVNDEPSEGYKWHSPINTTYGLAYVSSATENPVTLALPAGEHTVSVFVRETGTRLDKVALIPAPQAAVNRAVTQRSQDSAAANGVYGTVQIQDNATGATTDPDTIDFSQFELTLTEGTAQDDAYSAKATPDDSGMYRFEQMPASRYTLSVNVPEGYKSTLPASVTLDLTADQLRRYAPDMVAQVDGQAAELSKGDQRPTLFLPFTSRRNFKTPDGAVVVNWACMLDAFLLHTPETDSHPMMRAIMQACNG